jgi:hypothetical protein
VNNGAVYATLSQAILQNRYVMAKLFLNLSHVIMNELTALLWTTTGTFVIGGME